jgi:hypothetical protein
MGLLLGEEMQMMVPQGNRLRKWILQHNRPDVESYRKLKRAIGILGMCLPAICLIWGYLPEHVVQNSVSLYYYTNMRDVLVAILGCAAIFFMTYSGYGIIDNIVTWVIGVAGAGVVIFPCATYHPQKPPDLVGVLQLAQSRSDKIHLSFASAFFFLLAINSIFLFTLSKKDDPGPKKRLRNAIYRASGGVILMSLVTLGIVYIWADDFFNNSYIQIVFEFIMLFAFGVAWLVKGGVPYLRDGEP